MLLLIHREGITPIVTNTTMKTLPFEIKLELHSIRSFVRRSNRDDRYYLTNLKSREEQLSPEAYKVWTRLPSEKLNPILDTVN